MRKNKFTMKNYAIKKDFRILGAKNMRIIFSNGCIRLSLLFGIQDLL
jgi:hypothetical protein